MKRFLYRVLMLLLFICYTPIASLFELLIWLKYVIDGKKLNQNSVKFAKWYVKKTNFIYEKGKNVR